MVRRSEVKKAGRGAFIRVLADDSDPEHEASRLPEQSTSQPRQHAHHISLPVRTRSQLQKSTPQEDASHQENQQPKLGCNISSAYQSVECVPTHYLDCGHEAMSAEDTCGTNCLVANNWDGPPEKPFACTLCIQKRINGLHEDCARFMWSVVTNEFSSRSGEASGRRKWQHQQAVDIAEMMGGRICLIWGGEDKGFAAGMCRFKFPKIGTVWVQLASRAGGIGEVMRIQELFTALRLCSIGCPFELKGAAGDVDELTNSLKAIGLDKKQQTAFDETVFNDDGFYGSLLHSI